jgi:Skp family chaperone for outer membrane proteins
MSHKKLLSVIYYTRYIVVGDEEDRRQEVKQKVQNLHSQEKEQLTKDLEEELKAVDDEYATKLDDLKKSEKKEKTLQFKTSQLEHEKKQSSAMVRRDFA